MVIGIRSWAGGPHQPSPARQSPDKGGKTSGAQPRRSEGVKAKLSRVSRGRPGTWIRQQSSGRGSGSAAGAQACGLARARINSCRVTAARAVPARDASEPPPACGQWRASRRAPAAAHRHRRKPRPPPPPAAGTADPAVDFTATLGNVTTSFSREELVLDELHAAIHIEHVGLVLDRPGPDLETWVLGAPGIEKARTQ